MKARQAGFTLIELIVVILILGILAATALPRYAALQTQARIAKLNGALGAVKGAAALAHGACLANQSATTPCTFAAFGLNMEGATITLINQYPTADTSGIIPAAGLSPGPGQPLNPADGLQISGGGGAAGAVLTIQVLGNDATACSFTYTGANVDALGNLMAPLYGVPVTTGC